MTTIAVNTRLLLSNKLEGIGWFTYETLKRICTQHKEINFIFFFDRPFQQEFVFSDNIKPLVVSPQARHPLLYYWWFEKRLPSLLKKGNADLFFSPDGYLSLSANVRSHAVIHDLNFEHFPQHLPFLARNYYRYYFPKFAQKANRIATVSEFSKKDIKEKYLIDESKIDVVFNGASDDFRPASAIEKKETQKIYSKGHPYFLFIGSVNPRKNIINLLKAFELFKKTRNGNMQLLIAGEKRWWNGDSEKALQEMQYKNEVNFTGRLSNEQLVKVMGAAEALTYVSFFEGFGIPILEAMKSEVPIITSNTSSMPEIAGNAAIFVNPFSVETIKNAMVEITVDGEKRNELILQSRIQREKFSWDKTAELLWKSLEKTL